MAGNGFTGSEEAADDPRVLVSPRWLAARLGSPQLRILDGSWYLPAMERDARAEFAAERLPGARFFDIDAVATPDRDLPHMAPSPEQFSAALADLEITPGMQVVVYDGAGLFSAPRVWWTFRLMGWPNVAVLDGGMPAWRVLGLPLERGAPASAVPAPANPAPARTVPPPVRRDPALIRTADEAAAAAASGTEQLLDARPAARFRGEEPEPRPGLHAGHIPGARSLPFVELLDAEGRLKPPAELRAAFEGAGIDLSRPVICSCGSGVSAAVLVLALERLGHHQHALYDGSWAEWGRISPPDGAPRPVATGATGRVHGERD